MMADLVGTPGDDNLVGMSGNGRIIGLAGNDVLTAHGTTSSLIGGTGNDTYYLTPGFNYFAIEENVGEGYDVVYYSAAFGDTLFALLSSQEIEAVYATNPNSVLHGGLYGNQFAQTIGGSAGNNEFFGRGGADTLIGMKGDDIFHVVDPNTIVVEAANEGADTVYTTVTYRLTAGSSIEVLRVETGTTAAINLTGNELRQVIVGNDAANIINGAGGNDTLQGMGGDDIYQVGDSTAVVWESANQGYDVVFATVSFRLDAAVSVEALIADGAGATTPITLWGNELAQVIAGNAGNNLIVGGGGADTLIGRAGNDTYGVWDSSARVWEAVGEGYDIIYATVSFRLEAGQEVEALLVDDAASTTALSLVGNGFAQVIAGNAGANVLTGGGGADTLIGRGGDDVYFVAETSARVWENSGEGRDVIYSTVSYALEINQEIEQLFVENGASTNAINLTGNNLSQVLAGNQGVNILDGGLGNDTLVGRGGADSFVFTTTLGPNNIDWIYDFEVGNDKILLDDAVFAGLTPGALSAGAFVTGTAALDADDRIIYDSANSRLLFDADGSGAGAAVQFAVISAGLAITAADFTVI